MKNKKWILLTAVICILVFCFFKSRPQDTIALMENMISKHIKAKHSIMVYNQIVIDNHRLVSYVQEGKEGYQEVGYAHFILNDKGKYKLHNIVESDKIIEKGKDITIYEFSKLELEFSHLTKSDFSIGKSLFIISNNPQLAKIERIMDNGEIQVKEVAINPYISFFDDLDGNSKTEYYFYDKNGDIIE